MIISTRNLAQSIQNLRRDVGLSQQDLADLASVNMHTISRIERGLTSPTTQTLEKIFAAIVNCQEYTDLADEKGSDVFLSFDNLLGESK